MSSERFDHLLSLVGPLISKLATRFRNPISPSERLAVTLRYPATGDSQQSQSFDFRIGKSTVSNIIPETCDGTCQALLKNILLHQKALKVGYVLQRDFKMNGTSPIALEPLMFNIF